MRRRQFISFLGGAALSPLTALPVLADLPDGCGFPVARDDGWPVASANEDKLIDRGALCRVVDRLVASSANVHAVLVARSGKLVFERYFKGSDEINGLRVGSVTFDADTLHQRTDLQLLPRVVRLAFPLEGPHPVGSRADNDDGSEVGRGHPGQRGR